MPTLLGSLIKLACLFVLVHCQSKINTKNYGHSKLVLFRGKERHEIDGKSCTVGVAFDKPKRFSCACVNGIWAFYNEACAAPLAVIGGNNFCFRMPNIPIRHVTTISSPMRALSNSLTVFERNMESVKTKVFRNVHMQLDGTNDFVTMNSSWTIVSSDGKDEICLHSKDIKLDNFKMEGTMSAMSGTEGVYCTFRNVTMRIPRIGSILKGCNASTEIFDPMDCQPILPKNSEDICSSLPILEAFEDKAGVDSNDLELFRTARSNLFNWDITTTTTSTTTTEPPTTTSTTRYPPGYEKAPGWLQREIRQMVDSNSYPGYAKAAGRAMNQGAPDGKKSDTEMLEMLKKEWDKPMDFTLPPPSHSDSIITDQLWKYERKAIREQLKIKTPDDLIINENNSSSKASQLLYIIRDVMKKTCPLQKPEYFNMITDVFLQIQQKIFRWKEPYVKTLDFKRIEAALTACRESAVPLVKPSGTSCSVTGDVFSSPPLIPIPESLKSDGYEPIIESVWKILVSTHSYCYKNFNQFFNDHHKFTTIMFPFFTNEIHSHWFRNGSKGKVENDYAGIIGEVATIISNIDQCTFAARTKSSYPFHLTRPTPLLKYDLANKDKFIPIREDSVEKGSGDNKSAELISTGKISEGNISEENISTESISEGTAAATVEGTASEGTDVATEETASEGTAAATEETASELTAAVTEETASEGTDAATEETASEGTDAATEETASEGTDVAPQETASEGTDAATEETASEGTAAVTEETAAVTEETAAVTEETAAVTEETAAVTEETAAVTEEIAAVTEETASEGTNAATEEPASEGNATDTDASDSEGKEGRVRRAIAEVNGRRGDSKAAAAKDPWKKERRVMHGLGYCLKKYNEPKLHLQHNC